MFKLQGKFAKLHSVKQSLLNTIQEVITSEKQVKPISKDLMVKIQRINVRKSKVLLP